MHIRVFAALFCLILTTNINAQDLKVREKKVNLTVNEWNTDSRSKTRWLDHTTTYNDLGYKVEEIEYNQYGQKWRETYEYGENGKISQEVRYDEKNKVVYIRKYEYDINGRKVRQLNYLPNGKLASVKVFEYISREVE